MKQQTRKCFMCKQTFLKKDTIQIGRSKLKYWFCPTCAKRLYKSVNRNDTWRLGLKKFLGKKEKPVTPLTLLPE